MLLLVVKTCEWLYLTFDRDYTQKDISCECVVYLNIEFLYRCKIYGIRSFIFVPLDFQWYVSDAWLLFEGSYVSMCVQIGRGFIYRPIFVQSSL